MRWQLDPTGGWLFGASRALASINRAQTPLLGANVPQFVTALPTFVGKRWTAASRGVRFQEFQQRLLPDVIYNNLGSQFRDGTFVWGYQVDGAPASFPTTTIVARVGSTKTIKWENDLPVKPLLYRYLTVDQTLHWADPLKTEHSFDGTFGGPPPTTVHLHGPELS